MTESTERPWAREAPLGIAELETDDDDFLDVEQWPRDVYHLHYHEEFNWLVPVRAGRLVIRVDSAEHVLDGNHWICVFPRVPHAIVHVSDDHEVLSLFIPQSLMHRAWGAIEPKPLLGPCLLGGQGNVAQGLALQWGQQRFSREPADSFDDAFAFFLAGWLWRAPNADAAASSLALQLKHRLSGNGAATAAFLEEHLADSPFPFETLSRTLGLSIRTLQRQWADALGLSPSQVVAELRQERARELLVDPQRPMSDIALACGYSSQAHFSTAFKACSGMTPSAWRRLRTAR